MRTLLAFLESSPIDKEHFIVFRGDAGEVFELVWRRRAGQGRWALSREGDPVSIEFAAAQIPMALGALGVCPGHAVTQLRSCAAMQIAQASMFLTSAQASLGPDILEEAAGCIVRLSTTIQTLVEKPTLGPQTRSRSTVDDPRAHDSSRST